MPGTRIVYTYDVASNRHTENQMHFSIKAFDTKNTLAAAKSGCVAVAVFEGLRQNGYAGGVA